MNLRHLPCKIALHLKKVCYKVSLCEYCQQQSCKAIYPALSIRAKRFEHGERPLLREKLGETDQPFHKRRCSFIAPHP